MIDCDLDNATILECLRLSAKRQAVECISTIRRLHPEIVVDDWLEKYAERRAFEMDCAKYGIEGGEL